MAEMFDVYDEQGNWTGIAERSEVHAKGLWHQTVHCWLVRKADSVSGEGEEAGLGAGTGSNAGASAKILFQQRSANKDTNPGCFDITAAGHIEAGETPRAVVRELDEELGVKADFQQLREYGIIREQGTGVFGGVRYVDAEMSHVYGLVTSMQLSDFRLQEEEVAGLYEADAEALISLMEGNVEAIAAQGVELRSGKLQEAETRVTRSSFVFRDYDYYISVFKFLRELVQAR